MLNKFGSSLLPLAGAHQGRSARTCALKCGNACFHPVPNPTENDYFGDIVAHSMSRRTVLKGAASALVLAGVPGLLDTAPAGAATRTAPATNSGTGLRFAPIPPTDRAFDNVVVPAGYRWDVLARWGDPVVARAPAWDFTSQSAAAQALQFGYNCDYVGFLATAPGRGVSRSSRGLLTVNHEYTEPDRMFPDYTWGAPTREQVDIELAAHGISVLDVERAANKGKFRVVDGSPLSRRIIATTPMELTGPAAGDPLLRTSEDPTGTVVLGTLNNCAGGMTPWGTALSAEENFNQYFANRNAVTDEAVRESHARYGMPTGTSDRRWEMYYPRFDMAQEPNEPFRFGWIVEVDPTDPTFVPRKRTALGRFKHEAATISIANDGRAVAYMGDDERFDYVYKFVSRDQYSEGDKAHNLTLLDNGDLYVAKFTGDSPPAELERYNSAGTLGRFPDDGAFDGSGVWLPLITDGQSAVAGFTVAEVLIKTRQAADAVGATRMDRPEDVERNPVNGRVYLAMTNNTDRGRGTARNRRDPGIDEANPRKVDFNGSLTGNKYGHVVELVEARNDAAATAFTWRLFLVCGNPDDPTTYFAGFPKDEVSPVSCPDNVAFDANGNLWVGTDGAPGTIGKCDAFHAVPVTGPERGRARQFLSVPAGAEASGPEFTPDQRTLFCSVQHPGEGVPSQWPDFNGNPPRPSVISVFSGRGDKRIGS